MNQVTVEAFGDELAKIAGMNDWWNNFTDLFRSEDSKAGRRVDYFFSPKAGSDKWDKFAKNVRDPRFAKKVIKHPGTDPKLALHAKSMHQLARGKTVGKEPSTRISGRTYEIRKLPSGLGCTCPDWRYKGSVTPGYQCKHIKSHSVGKEAA